MKKFKIISIFLCVVMASCHGKGNKNTLFLYRDKLEIETPYSDIKDKYGFAQRKWRDSDGNKILSYSYSKPRYSIFSFLPIPFTYSKFDNFEVILVVDSDGNLSDIKKFHDKIKIKSWLICESQIADCDLEYEIIK